jgi:hypothetical protein
MAKERKVSLQVDVFVKEGEINEVKQSAHLGNQVMSKDEDGSYGCLGVYNRPASTVPVTFDLYSLGYVAGKVEPTGATGTNDVTFNALAWLDEPEKAEALSDDEKKELQHIGVVALNQKVINAILEHKPTPMSDAAMAIMQHALGTDEDFPKPVVTQDSKPVVGDHADGTDALLTVAGAMFETGGKYWAFCEYKVCDDNRELYRFTWVDVPVSVLNE